MADATRLDVFYDGNPLKVTYDTGRSIVGRVNSCMSLEGFDERIILVKEPLGSGKSFQARSLKYNRVCWLTSTRALAAETCRISGFTSYQDVPYTTPLGRVDKVVVLGPSLYRMRCEFQNYDCLVIDEAESFFDDLFSGLCRGSNFELCMDVFKLLMETSKKIVFLDGFLKNSSLSVAIAFAEALSEIRLVIGKYTVDRGSL